MEKYVHEHVHSTGSPSCLWLLNDWVLEVKKKKRYIFRLFLNVWIIYYLVSTRENLTLFHVCYLLKVFVFAERFLTYAHTRLFFLHKNQYKHKNPQNWSKHCIKRNTYWLSYGTCSSLVLLNYFMLWYTPRGISSTNKDVTADLLQLSWGV